MHLITASLFAFGNVVPSSICGKIAPQEDKWQGTLRSLESTLTATMMMIRGGFVVRIVDVSVQYIRYLYPRNSGQMGYINEMSKTYCHLELISLHISPQPCSLLLSIPVVSSHFLDGLITHSHHIVTSALSEALRSDDWCFHYNSGFRDSEFVALRYFHAMHGGTSCYDTMLNSGILSVAVCVWDVFGFFFFFYSGGWVGVSKEAEHGIA
ncbi:hypothetical protein BDN70DRAFT_899995 [Pholiota conissans]|uniref:Uncharacterized protein n=1 Tax=Pholiota conissans TaxID=109636 RepID=A0A9P5YQB7_9AGAR|nr:hypothetical protein BDN70DRAFT_899995 [Pholiota conissans]